MRLKVVFLVLVLLSLIYGTNGWFRAKLYLKYFSRQFTSYVDKVVPNTECSKQLKAWIGDLLTFKKTWALKMLDATAKPQTGLLSLNIFHFGDYDECLSIHEVKPDLGVIEGKYCTAVLLPLKNSSGSPDNLLDFATTLREIVGVGEADDLKQIVGMVRLSFGLCLPKACSADSIQILWNHLEYTFGLQGHLNMNEDFCTYKGKVPFRFPFDGLILWGFAFYILLLCLATVYDLIILTRKEGYTITDEIIRAFSLTTNTSKIFQTSPNLEESNNFSCLKGVKMISMLWVIFGHVYLVGMITGVSNMIDHFQWRKSVSALTVFLAPYAVNNFLVISGLLLSYRYLQIREVITDKKGFLYLVFFSGRFLRLSPALIATILLYMSVLKYTTQGPFWPLVIYKAASVCRYSGWITALFATNLVKFRHQCMENSWYVAVDTQLWLLAPFILPYLAKHPRKTVAALVAVSLTSMVYTYFVTVLTNEKWSVSDGVSSYHEQIYQSTFVRAPIWICGLITGTVLQKIPKLQLPKVLVSLIWLGVVLTFFSVGGAHNILSNLPYDPHYAGVYNAIAGLLWSMALCCLIVLCCYGYGGVVNQFLSLKWYRPLEKISYSVYLLHPSVILYIHGSARTSRYHTIFTTFHDFLGDLPFVVVASFIWCLAFELPFIHIMKLLLTRIVNKGSAIKHSIEFSLDKVERVKHKTKYY